MSVLSAPGAHSEVYNNNNPRGGVCLRLWDECREFTVRSVSKHPDYHRENAMCISECLCEYRLAITASLRVIIIQPSLSGHHRTTTT